LESGWGEEPSKSIKDGIEENAKKQFKKEKTHL